MSRNIIIIGGGAAGFFAAITCAENNPGDHVTILEKSDKLLAKVKVSGGGRCNVTHACFDPRQLVKYYPRGEKQLLGPFTRFNPSNTTEWFENRGVELKAEGDGRMFPVSDSSQTIINCFLTEAQKLGIKIRTQVGVEEIEIRDNSSDACPTESSGRAKFCVATNTREQIIADAVIVTSGSSAQVWRMMENLGIKVIPPVPTLFTFNIKDERIKGLEGLSVPNAAISVLPLPTSGLRIPTLSTSGPLLITHWGMSGPAVLRLSAWGARILDSVKHQFEIEVNWTGELKTAEIKEHLKQVKKEHPKRNVAGNALFNIPKRLWERLVISVIQNQSPVNYADLSNKQIERLEEEVTAGRFKVNGKSTFKDEFVTAGGVDLNEVDFKTMQSKKIQGLYFAGEVLDIDAITGGFNFQAAWTTGWIAGSSVLTVSDT